MSIICQATNDVAVASLSTPAFDAREFFKINIRISGYSASSVARVRFNNDTGSTSYSFSVSEDGGVPSVGKSGTCSGIDLAVTPDVGRSVINFRVSNIPGVEHGITFIGSSGTLSAANPTVTVVGSGLWSNTSPITSVQVEAGTGGGTLDPGSVIIVLED